MTFRHKLYIFTLLVALSLLVSCGNLFGGGTTPQNPSGPNPSQNGKVAPTCTIYGTFNTEGAVPAELISVETTGERTALPCLPSISYEIDIYKNNRMLTESSDGVVINIQTLDRVTGYSVGGLTYGTYTLKARAKNSSGSYVLESESKEVVLNETATTFSHAFVLRPTKTGTGSISLAMEFEQPVQQDVVCELVSPVGELSLSGTISSGQKEITLSADNIDSGCYPVTISFYKTVSETRVLIYSFDDVINVCDNLTTSVWVENGDVPYLVRSDNQIICKITDDLIETFKITNFYVDGTNGDDEKPGSFFEPFRTISKAISFVNVSGESSKDYTIRIKGTFSDGVSVSSLDVNSLTIRKWNASATIDGASRGIEVSANKPVAFDGLVVENCDKGVNVASGAIVTLRNCTVRNCSDGNGGGVYSEGSLTLDGETSIPSDNGANSIYLPESTKITIGSGFSWQGNNAFLVLPSYSNGTTVLDGEIGSANEKFTLSDALFSIGADGKLVLDPNIYISSSGSADGDGTSAHPYATVSQAIARIRQLDNAAAYVLHVSGTIQDAVTLALNETSLGDKPTSIRICGSSATNDILNATGRNSSVVTINASVPVTLEKLTVTGGNVTGNGGGVKVGSSSDVTIVDCVLTNNSASGNGGGVYVGSGSVVSLRNSTISSNTATQNGAGVFNDGTFKVSGSVNVSNNGSLANNVYLPSGKLITVTGALAGSNIGVTVSSVPELENPIVITEGYRTYNGASVGSVFTSDDEYVVKLLNNEVLFTVTGGSGTITPQVGDLVTISCDKTTVSAGTSAVLTFTVMDGESNITERVKNTFSFVVRSHGRIIDNSHYSQNANKVTLSELPADTYSVTARMTYNGMSYSQTHTVTITE